MWHGANWTFIIWGLYYFVLLLIEKKTKFTEKLGWFSHIYTLFFVIIAWVIFRSNDISSAVLYIGNMLGIGSNGIIDSMTVDYIKYSGFIIPIAILLSTPLIKNIWKKIKINESIKEFIKLLIIILIFIFSILTCIKSTYNPFIYFNF